MGKGRVFYVARRRRVGIYGMKKTGGGPVCEGARRNMVHMADGVCAGVVTSGQLTWKEQPNEQQLAGPAAGGV